jgi:hypothetical protein
VDSWRQKGSKPLFGVETFAALGALENLKFLDLRYDGRESLYLSDAALGNLHRLSRLEILWFRQCRASDEAVANLRAALPDCKIIIVPIVFMEPKLFGGGFHPKFEAPSTSWLVQRLVDIHTPRPMRMQAAAELSRATNDALRPHVSALLSALVQEQDRQLISQLADVVQRMGPKAVPDVKSAIDRAQSDLTRRELLRALSGLGSDGKQEFARLMQSQPDYQKLFSDRLLDGPKPLNSQERNVSLLEQSSVNANQPNPMIEYRHAILRGDLRNVTDRETQVKPER